MGKKYDFNYIVIGSGPAGSAAAISLAKAKNRVALVENRFFGGTNLNSRDIPYAVSLDFSHTYAKINSFPELKNQDFTFSFPTLVARQLNTIINISNDNKKSYEAAGVVCLSGYANFLDNHTIAIGSKKITAAHFIIATGSHLKTSEIAGTNTVGFLTPETAIKIRRLPKAIMVVGGGSTGCEIAEYFAELGAKVLIAETANRLLPREDKEASEVITNYLTHKLGIVVLTGSKVTALEQDDFSKRVIFRNARTEKMVRVDCIILATGSEPNLDCGLENAGVKYSHEGIKVDKLFQTSAKNIYAIGDCIGGESSTERAEYEGSILAANLIHKTKNSIDYLGITRITNTLPMVATVGLNEDDLARRDRKFNKALIKLSDIPASKIYNFNHGFIKLLTDKNHHIIGATIVAPHAELIAEEIALAIRHKLTVLEIASTPHSANSWNYAIKLAAKKLLPKKK